MRKALTLRRFNGSVLRTLFTLAWEPEIAPASNEELATLALADDEDFAGDEDTFSSSEPEIPVLKKYLRELRNRAAVL